MDFNDLEFLQMWIKNALNNDYLESSLFKISTIDNPGWKLEINIEKLNSVAINLNFKIDRSDRNWIVNKIENGFFKGYGGSLNLVELIKFFNKFIVENDCHQSFKNLNVNYTSNNTDLESQELHFLQDW